MRTETRTYTIYTLSELTEEARQKAYSDWLSHSEYDWADENAAALKKFEQIFNIEVRSWNYDGCTYGYRFFPIIRARWRKCTGRVWSPI